MELVLTIVAGLGALLFLISYLAFMLAGFKHHFVTGIISTLPILNIVTVPALWHKASKSLMMSLLGIVIAGAGWFLGADENIKKILFNTSNTTSVYGTSSAGNMSKTMASQAPKQVVGTTIIRPLNDEISTAKPFANKQRTIDEENMLKLPIKALYKFSFETVPLNKLNSLAGRVVKLTTNKNKIIEGRVSKVTNNSIFLQSGGAISIESEFPIANIKQVRLMVKKAIQ